jgi:hypothetical protein
MNRNMCYEEMVVEMNIPIGDDGVGVEVTKEK